MYFIKRLALLFCALMLFGQNVEPSVIDNGGGIARSPELMLLSSIGQAVSGTSADEVEVYLGFVSVETAPSDIEEGVYRPDEKEISSFFPNPFNSRTQIKLNIPEPGKVSLDIFDIFGKRVHSWSSELSAGDFLLSFTPDEKMPTGLYVYRVSTQLVKSNQTTIKTGKVTFIK